MATWLLLPCPYQVLTREVMQLSWWSSRGLCLLTCIYVQEINMNSFSKMSQKSNKFLIFLIALFIFLVNTFSINIFSFRLHLLSVSFSLSRKSKSRKRAKSSHQNPCGCQHITGLLLIPYFFAKISSLPYEVQDYISTPIY